MVKKILAILVFFGLLLLISYFSVRFPGYPQKNGHINGWTITLYVADTEARKIRGLSGSSPLSETEGMLFTFSSPGRYGFWMKDMKFPLDFIYLKDNKVVAVLKNAQPNSFPHIFVPEHEFTAMIEVKAGVAEKIDAKPGTVVIY